MQARSLLAAMAAAGVMFLTSCTTQHLGTANGDGSIMSRGLGKFASFAGQEQGESYTTRAPHNQVYLFAYDDSTLDSKYSASINAQAEYLKKHPGAHVLLAGHTDERGSREYNIALGERRANTVASLLRMSGVSRQQIRVVSYGKERPVYSGHDDAAHRQNRRVEMVYEATQ